MSLHKTAKSYGRTYWLESLARFRDPPRKWYIIGQEWYDSGQTPERAADELHGSAWAAFMMGFNAREAAEERGLEPSVIGVNDASRVSLNIGLF